MYEQVFRFNRRPFTLAPFAGDYCPLGSIEECRLSIMRSIERNNGPVVVVGGAGSGKSMLMTRLNEDLTERFKPLYVNCSKWTQRSELLKTIMFELRLPYKQLDEGELRLALIDYVQPGGDSNEGLVMLLDDAQSLHPRIIDELSLMNNIVRDGQTRVQLVLAGQYKIEETLAHPKLTSFNQRISTRCYLQELNYQQTHQYVTAHIETAGRDCQEIFNQDALDAVYERSGGIPRLINQLCDAVLLRCAADGVMTVNANLVGQVWSEIHQIPLSESITHDSEMSIEFGQLSEDKSSPSLVRTDNANDTSESSESFGACLSNADNEEENSGLVHAEIAPGLGIDDSSNEQENALNELLQQELDPAPDTYKKFEVTAEPKELPQFDNNDPFGGEFESDEEVVDSYAEMVSVLNKKAASVIPEQVKNLTDSTLDLEEFRSEIAGFQPNVEDCVETKHEEDIVRETLVEDIRDYSAPENAVNVRAECEAFESQELNTCEEKIEKPGVRDASQQTAEDKEAHANIQVSDKSTNEGWSESELLEQIYQQQSAIAHQLDATLNVSVNTNESSVGSEEISQRVHEVFRMQQTPQPASDETNATQDSGHESQSHRIESQLTGEADDDRDLIIMSQEQMPPPNKNHASDDRSGPEFNQVPSTGRAKRVDYETLFAHLRSGN